MSYVPNNVIEGMVSDRIVEVDTVCGDKSHKFDETIEVDGGSSSMIGEATVVWDPSIVRSMICTKGFSFGFLVRVGSFLIFVFWGLGMVGLDCECG